MYFEFERARSGAVILLFSAICLAPSSASAQSGHQDELEFGPIVRAYLQYLDTEQNVVDDRISRREVSPGYYRRNSNPIHALRALPTSLARANNNDYLHE